MRKEALVPILRANPQEERLALQEEGMSLIEAFYEGELAKLKQEGFYLIYLCAPLRETEQRSFQWYRMEAFRAASQIVGARRQGRDVSLWIPHLHVYTVFNEMMFPEARRAAIAFNNRLLNDRLFDALLIAGAQISEGMRGEIRTARGMGIEVIGYENFMKNAEGLPSHEESIDYLDKLVTLFESNLNRSFTP